MTGRTLRDLLDDSASGTTVVRGLDGRSAWERSLGELWADARRTASDLHRWRGEGGVGAVLTNDLPSIQILLCSIANAVSLTSLPPPRAGENRDDWARATARRVSSQRLATVFCVSPTLRAALLNRGVSTHTPDELRPRGLGGSVDDSGIALRQYTSGTTGEASLVELTGTQIATNIESILDRIHVAAGDSACSWLPLSHDMGLIGMLLATLAAGGPRHTGGTHLTLLTPRSFAARPRSWLDTCREVQATITAAPAFALRMASEATSGPGDLGALRCVLVGGEVVRESTMTAAIQRGLRASAFCPAYGMAEATLAVSISSPEVAPLVVAGRPGSPFEGTDYVTCGEPLPGVEARIEPASGEIVIRGDTVTSNPAGSWRHTHDVGLLHEGQLVVMGRSDDVLTIRGLRIAGSLVDDAVSRVPGVRSRRAVAVQMGDGGLGIVVELRAGVSLDGVLDEVRAVCIASCGVRPERVYALAPGGLPITSSGKLGRARIASLLAEGSLPVRPATSSSPITHRCASGGDRSGEQGQG